MATHRITWIVLRIGECQSRILILRPKASNQIVISFIISLVLSLITISKRCGLGSHQFMILMKLNFPRNSWFFSERTRFEFICNEMNISTKSTHENARASIRMHCETRVYGQQTFICCLLGACIGTYDFKTRQKTTHTIKSNTRRSSTWIKHSWRCK